MFKIDYDAFSLKYSLKDLTKKSLDIEGSPSTICDWQTQTRMNKPGKEHKDHLPAWRRRGETVATHLAHPCWTGRPVSRVCRYGKSTAAKQTATIIKVTTTATNRRRTLRTTLDRWRRNRHNCPERARDSRNAFHRRNARPNWATVAKHLLLRPSAVSVITSAEWCAADVSYSAHTRAHIIQVHRRVYSGSDEKKGNRHGSPPYENNTRYYYTPQCMQTVVYLIDSVHCLPMTGWVYGCLRSIHNAVRRRCWYLGFRFQSRFVLLLFACTRTTHRYAYNND